MAYKVLPNGQLSLILKAEYKKRKQIRDARVVKPKVLKNK